MTKKILKKVRKSEFKKWLRQADEGSVTGYELMEGMNIALKSVTAHVHLRDDRNLPAIANDSLCGLSFRTKRYRATYGPFGFVISPSPLTLGQVRVKATEWKKPSTGRHVCKNCLKTLNNRELLAKKILQARLDQAMIGDL
ncbi:MAG: hypothetical protein ABSD38_34130 [Syntrophorhabdales bacterium]|jgi:hypothetical protein